MEEILNKLQSLMPGGFETDSFLLTLAALSAGVLVLGCIGRFAFGKRSVLHGSVSSAIGILFIYALTIVIHSTGMELGFLLSPLPFISLSGDYLSVFSFMDAHYTVICGEVLNMVILAFTVNLIDSWLPTGNNVFVWFLLRCISVALGTVAYTIVMGLLAAFLPVELLTWAPVILLGLLVLALLTGALKVVVGAVMATVNPLLAVLYTFFFASFIGKMVTKAILTTLIIGGLVYLLNYLGVSFVFIGAAALLAYIPVLLVVLVLWYVIGHLL